MTGKAWAGKTTLVNFFLSKTDKNVILLWTTGIAAINIWGKTMHSFFWIIPGIKTPRMTKENMQKFKRADIIFIEEASMLRADDFDKIDGLCKKIMMVDDAPFWGKQFVFVWDLFQLPPVPESDLSKRKDFDEKYKWLFFFFAKSYDRNYFEIVELKKVYRQTNQEFISVLNQLRIGGKSSDLVNYLNKRVINSVEEIHPQSIYIATTNKLVFEKNKVELDKLPSKYFISEAVIRWFYDEDSYPTDAKIFMKIWARIMFTVNHKDKTYVNWTLWTIENITQDWLVIIQKDDGEMTTVGRHTWLNMKDDDGDEDDYNIIDADSDQEMEAGQIIGSFNQYPFKIAFAITIHKSQGQTFDHIVIDLWWWAFADGQVYVALSRATSYEWLQLIKPVKTKDIMASKDVLRYMQSISW